MRLLHLASGREWRGGQRQTLLLARGLSAEGSFSQVVLTARHGELARRAVAEGITVLPATWRAGLDPRAAFACRRAARHADLVHAHDAHAVTIAAVALAGRTTPLVVTRRMARPLRHALPWRRAAGIIAISDAVRRSLETSGVPAERITVIPPAIDLHATLAVRPAEWQRELDVSEGSPVAATVAALTPEKGIDLVVEAAALLRHSCPSLHWAVVGNGPERPGLEALARARGVEAHVHFLGYRPDPVPVLAAAAVAVFPSREEGFGTSIVDALALGVPVVATAVGGIPEALARGGGVMVPAENAPALADAVERIIRDPAHRATVGAAGRAAAQHFDLAPMVERVVAVYRSAMGVR